MSPYRLYAAGGILAVEAPEPALALPDGFVRRAGPYHITLLDIDDSKAIRAARGYSSRKYEAILDTIVKADAGPFGVPVLLGVGRAENAGNIAYFEVFDWHEAQSWRSNRYSLGRKDFHATIGYCVADVRGVPKDVSTLVSP